MLPLIGSGKTKATIGATNTAASKDWFKRTMVDECQILWYYYDVNIVIL